MSKRTSVTCSSCGAQQKILRPDPAGELLWECTACEARNVDGEGIGHAAVDPSEGHLFSPEPDIPDPVVLVADTEEAGSADARAQ